MPNTLHVLLLHCLHIACAGAMENADQDGVGSLFMAHRGHGAFAAPLWLDGTPRRVTVNDLQVYTCACVAEQLPVPHSSALASAIC